MAKVINRGVRALIEAERQRVLAELRSLARTEKAAREKELRPPPPVQGADDWRRDEE